MSLYLLYSDPHLADWAPSSCTGTYTDDLFGLLEQINRVAVRRKVTAVVCAGDFWHIKSPSRTSHRLVQRAIRTLRSCPVPYYIAPGNHDYIHDRPDSVHETQPLGVLFESGAATRLDGWAEYDGPPGRLPVYGVPWQQEWSGEAVHEALRDWREPELPKRPALVVAHAPLYPPGQELTYENYPAWVWAEDMGARGAVFYGHVHEPHGVYQTGGVVFCNNGALSRGSLHEYNLTRPVGCTIWDSDRIGEEAFEFVPLDARPASEVFRLQEKQQATDMQGRLDEFLAAVQPELMESLNMESALAHFRTLGLGKDAEDLIEELLTEAAHGGK